MITHVVCFALFLAQPSTGPGGTTSPTSEPAPATMPTPHGAAVAAGKLAAALEAGDVLAAREVFHVDPKYAELADAYLDVLAAGVRLRDAITETYTPGHADEPLGPPVTPAPVVVREKGASQAWVRMNREDTPLMFRRVGGVWKLDIEAAAGIDEENLLEQTRLFQAIAMTLTELSTDIRGNRYPNAADARVAVTQKMSDLMSKRRLTTQPTTKRGRRSSTTSEAS